jgi:excisionase family DNA binding protein
MSDCFLSLKRAAEVLGVSTRTLRRMIAAGSGPQVTQLSTRRLGIRQSHLNEWSAGKIMGRFEATAYDRS